MTTTQIKQNRLSRSESRFKRSLMADHTTIYRCTVNGRLITHGGEGRKEERDQRIWKGLERSQKYSKTIAGGTGASEYPKNVV